MMQLPVFRRPEVWSFAPNCITESAENLLIVLFCHCLSYRCVFVMHNSTDIKEHSITLILLRTCRAFFGLGDSGCFHCDDCAFVSGSYPYTHDSSLITTVRGKIQGQILFRQPSYKIYMLNDVNTICRLYMYSVITL